jgi:hypothetical protein
VALSFGPAPVSKALPELAEFEDRVRGIPKPEALVRTCSGWFLAMADEIEQARRVTEEALAAVRDLGLESFLVAFGSQIVADLEWIAGNEERVIEALREGVVGARALGWEHHLDAGWLARQLAYRGEDEEAMRFARVAAEAEPLAVSVHIYWRQAEALVLARSEDASGARRRLHEALELIPQDWLTTRGDAWWTAARMERILGGREASDLAVDEAVRCFDLKGAIALTRRVREWQEASD